MGAAVYAAAALSVTAALIHLWAMPEHFPLWWGYGAFFLAAAAAQGFFGVALLRWPARALFVAGIWANLAIITLYVVTRVRGIPLGPYAGVVEEPGFLDLAATAAELGLVIALARLLTGVCRRRTINALLLVGAAIWAWRLAGGLS